MKPVNTSDIADFLAPWCKDEGPMSQQWNCRVKVGPSKAKRRARVWDGKPLPLTGQNPQKCAIEVERRLHSERGEKVLYYWVEIIAHGAQGPEHWMDDPGTLEPVEPEEPEEEDDGVPLGKKGLERMVAESLRAATENRKIDVKAYGAEIDRLYNRVEHLEGAVTTLMDDKLKLSVELAESKAKALLSDPMAMAVSEFAPHLKAAMPDILEKMRSWGTPGTPSASTAPAKPQEPGQPTDPGDDFDAIMMALGLAIQENPRILTQVRWDKFKAGYAQMEGLARMIGLK